MKPSSQVVVAAALVAALAGAALAPALDNDFIRGDDDHRIVHNSALGRPLSWDTVRWAFSADAAREYTQPLTWLAFAALSAGSPPAPRTFHAASLAAHAAAAVLLLLLLWRATGALPASAAAAALWAVHPLAVEPVAWATELNTLLASALALLSLHAYVSFARTRPPASYAAAFAAYAASLLAKPWLFALPVAMLALDAWPLRRIPVDGAGAGRGRAWAPLVLEKVPMLALGGAWAVYAMGMMEQRAASLAWSSAARPLLVRLAHAPVAVVRYLGKVVVPTELALDYPFPDRVAAWQVAGALAVVAGITIGAVVARRRAPALLSGWVWFLALVAPTLGIVQAGKWPAIALRFAYFPMIGLVAGAVFSVAPLLEARPRLRAAAAAALAGVAGVLVLATRAEAALWRDTVTLLSHAQAVAPGSALVENLLGTELGKQGRLPEAEALLRLAIRDGGTPSTHNQLGTVLLMSGRIPEAAAEYERAVALDPRSAEALYNLARILEAQGRQAEARERYRQFVAVAPPWLEPLKRDVERALAP